MSVKIISVWNPKGGQGKSLLSINLAGAAVKRGLVPLVVCQDPQGTSTEYGRQGQCPFSVIQKMPREKPDADLVLMDEQAGDWELPAWNMVVMPVRPVRDQFLTFHQARKLALAANKVVLPIVTDAHHQRRPEREIAIKLSKMGAMILPASGVFGRAALGWTTIFDPKLDHVYGVNDRRNNLLNILDKIMGDQA